MINAWFQLEYSTLNIERASSSKIQLMHVHFVEKGTDFAYQYTVRLEVSNSRTGYRVEMGKSKQSSRKSSLQS